MANNYFQFKQFTILQQRSAMKVTTDGCLFGAWVAEEIKKHSSVKTLLDIGTGTGLLSLMIAQKNEVAIDALEIDENAAEEAEQNIHNSPWNGQIRIFQADVLQWQPERKYDMVVCNPPFYEKELNSPQPKRNIAHHSAELKLSQLLPKITELMSEKGNCFLLLPTKREVEIDKLLHLNNLQLNKKILVHQTEKHAAFRMMLQCSFAPNETFNQKIIIKNGGNYTPEFRELLKDYYLYL